MGQHGEEVIDLRDGATHGAPRSAGRASSRDRWHDRTHRPRRRVAFVLAGGATRGAIQVGMLRALEERGIRPDLLVGTSVGAMNAAVYGADATGDGIERLDELWCRARRSQIFPVGARSVLGNLRERRGHLLPNDGLRAWIEEHLDHERLEDFPVPMHVVATEVGTGDPVLLSEGDALTALLASTAIPGVFPPVAIDGRTLCDGGVAADVPLPQALELAPTTVFVLPTVAETPPRPGPWTLLDRIFGRPARDATVPDHTGVAVHWMPAPAYDGNPYSFRASRRLIDQAHDLARARLGQIDFDRADQADRTGRTTSTASEAG